MSTLVQASRSAAARFAGSDSPQLDADLLLAHALGRDRSYLRAHADMELSQAPAAAFERLVEARSRGEPVAYLTGKREFWSLELKVTPATLIPRPETELLVEQALAVIPPGAEVDVLDLGTGCGAVALAIAKERPHCRVTAVDISMEALAVARDNAAALHLHNIDFLQGDWFAPVVGHRFHAIASNPPYVAVSDPHLMQGDLCFEPQRALSSGEDGLQDIRRIVSAAPEHLIAGGHMLLEHGYGQGTAVRNLLGAAGFANAHSIHDLAGLERVSAGEWASARSSR